MARETATEWFRLSTVGPPVRRVRFTPTQLREYDAGAGDVSESRDEVASA
eukprot:gene28305-9770_t